MTDYFDIAFTPPVLDLQAHKGSAGRYERTSGPEDGPTRLGPDETEHISSRDSFYLASVGGDGWPYVQHRGGEAGFVTVMDPTTIGWLERHGNRQYVGTGNITADGRVAMIFVDYPRRTRLKLYGRATYHPDPDPELIEALGRPGWRIDGAVTVEVVAFAWNCPKQITPRFTAEEVRAAVEPLHERIAELERQLEAVGPGAP